MDKDFTTLDEQLNILESRNLKFVSKENSLILLRRYGYYNIINGYKEEYVRLDENNVERYKDDVTFEQIYSLYNLDREIRNSVMETMLELEDNLKAALSYVIAENFGASQDKYLKRENYNLGTAHQDGHGNTYYTIDTLMRKFDKIKRDNKEPFKHYRENYGNIPPWILLKGASFGNIVNFIKIQKPEIKNKLISILYNIPEHFVDAIPELKELFADTIYICLDYRNKAAHGGRIYNFKANNKFRYNQKFHDAYNISSADYRNGKGQNYLNTIVKALSIMDNKSLSRHLKAAISFYSEEHLNLYPSDRAFLDYYLDSTHYIKLYK